MAPAFNPSHPCLEGRPPAYSIANGRIMHGHVIIAYVYETETGNLKVRAPGGRLIDLASTMGEALMLAVGDFERPRTSRRK